MSHTGRVLAAISMAFLAAVLLCSCGQKKQAQEGGQGGGGESQISPRYAEQAQMLESTLKDDPNNVGILTQIGNLYYDWGQDEVNKKAGAAQPGDKWAKAVDYYKHALEIQPGNVNVRVDMANLLGFLGRTDEAIGQYRLAIKTDPKHPQARINLILALGQQKRDYKAALSEYDALLKVIPEAKDNPGLKQEVDGFREAMKEAKK